MMCEGAFSSMIYQHMTHKQSHNEGVLPNRGVDLCTPAEQRFCGLLGQFWGCY